MTNSGPGELTREIAGILRGARARQNLSQARLAEVAGVSQSQLSKMLRGLRHITVDQLDAMCAVLGLQFDEVVRESDAATDARHRLLESRSPEDAVRREATAEVERELGREADPGPDGDREVS